MNCRSSSTTTLTWQQLLAFNPDSIIISPGPGRPENDRDFGICRQIILESSIPVLGVCLGFQGIAHLFGGTIERAPEPVHGRSSRIFHDGNGLFAGIPQGFSAVRYHSLTVRNPIPRALRTTAWTSEEMPMALERERHWGVQFHPESISTDHGVKMLENFRRLSRQRSSYVPSTIPSHKISEPPRNIEVKENGNWKVYSRKLHQYPSTEATFCSLFGDATPAFWLDSAETPSGRFSFMGSASGPSGMWLSYYTEGTRLELHTAGREEIRQAPLLDFLKSELQRRRCSSPELPFDFNGGFVGYFGYELKSRGAAGHRSPHADAVMFADRMIAFDHKENSVYLVYADAAMKPQAEAWFNEIDTVSNPDFLNLRQRFLRHRHGIPSDQTHELLESVRQCGTHSRRRELRNLPDESADRKGSDLSHELLSRAAAIQSGAQLGISPVSGCFRCVFFTGTIPED